MQPYRDSQSAAMPHHSANVGLTFSPAPSKQIIRWPSPVASSRVNQLQQFQTWAETKQK